MRFDMLAPSRESKSPERILTHSGGSVQSRRMTAAILALATAAALTACTEDGENPLEVGNDNATVRIFNATTSSLAVDVAKNGTVDTGNGNIPFGSGSACTKVNDTNPQLTIRPSGSSTNLTGFAPSFTAGGTFTVLVTGTQAAPAFKTLNDQLATPSGGNAAVRIINATTSAAAGAGTWDIYVNPTGSLGTPNAAAIGRTSASNYLTVPAGQSNTIRLTNAGQTATLQNITVPNLTAGAVTTIVVTDAATAGGTLRTFTLPPCT